MYTSLINNRYVYRYIVLTPLLFLLFFGPINQLSAQVVLKGETEAIYGSPKLLNYEQCDGNDLKITILKNGLVVPENQGYIAGQNLASQKYILLFPSFADDEDQAVFTIVSTLNKDNKTHSHIHVITVKRPKPLPKPTPIPNVPIVPPVLNDELLNKLTLAYNKSPNPEQLKLVIQIMEEVRKGIKDTGADDYKTFDDVQMTFRNTANKYLKFTDLRDLRDTLGDYQVNKWGIDPRKYDHALAKSVMDELITKLRLIK